MKHKLILLTTMWTLFALALAGCSGGGGAGDPNATPTSVSEGPREDAQGQTVPDDIPVIPGAYNLDVFSNGTQVNFRVDGGIEDVMAYYAEELEANGWMPTRSPDNAIGVTGTMVRQNEAGDTVSLNMSYNMNGDFVTVLIAISRK